MCILFLIAPKEHRTKSDLFWVLLEVITELYALSILFTIIQHESVRSGMKEVYPIVEAGPVQLSIGGQTQLDRIVEGYPSEGDSPLSPQCVTPMRVEYFTETDEMDKL